MPKIFNTSWLAVILATVIFYMIGFLWYGFLFEDVWLAASGLSASEVEAMASAKGPMILVWGLLITLAQALGLLWILNHAGAKRLSTCLSTYCLLGLCHAWRPTPCLCLSLWRL